MFNHKNQTNSVPSVKTPKNSYDFVSQYTLIDPKKLLANEEAFALCHKIPVVYENSQPKDAWHVGAQLHTKVMLPFIRALRAAKPEDIAPADTRTVSVIELAQGKYIYVLPRITMPKTAEMYIVFDNDNENAWPLYMTPEKRKAVVEQIKVHTR